MPLLPAFYTILLGPAPLPPPFLNALSAIEVETSTEEAAVLRLRFDLSQTPLGDWDVLQFDLFRPLIPVSIRVQLGLGVSETIINGYVRDARLNTRTEPGRSTLEVVGMDATATLMNLQEKVMPWPNLSDSMMAMAIFGQYGILPAVYPTAPSRVMVETTTIQRGTDIRFLRELAQRNAFECFVQPDPLLGRDLGVFRPPQVFFPPQGVLSVNFGLATNMEDFHVSYDMLQPTSALALVLDDATKASMPGPAFAAVEPPMGLEPTLLRILSPAGPPLVRPTAEDAANPGELLTSSLSIATRSSRCIRSSGEVDGLKYGRVLRPGLPVAVRGAGRQHSGIYYVTRVSHSISTSQYTQRFDAWRNAVGLTGAELFIDPFAAIS